MIATLNVTNSYISIGCLEKEQPLFLERISTNLKKTDLEYAVDLLQTFAIHRLEISDVEGCVLSSVVPALTSVFVSCVTRVFGKRPYIVRAEEQTLIPVRIDQPSQLGAKPIAVVCPALFCALNEPATSRICCTESIYESGIISSYFESKITAGILKLSGKKYCLSSNLPDSKSDG